MHDTLKAQLDKYFDPRQHKFLSLRFTRAAEERYRADARLGRDLRPVIIAIALVIIDLFWITDYLQAPADGPRSAILRFGIVTPVGIAALYVLRRGWLAGHEERIYAAIAFLATVCAISASPDLSAAMAMDRQIGCILFIFGVLTSLGLRLEYAYGFGIAVLGTDARYLFADPWLNGPTKWTLAAFLAASTVLALLASYRIEWSKRASYLLLLSQEERSMELANLNRKLDELSQADPLTGISNRRHFDEYLNRLWNRAKERPTPISIIMADLDRFKCLNDTYGHLAGDQVLIAVAGILQENVRVGQDVVARFGGEEFVMLIPADVRVAVRAAERIRAAVADAKLNIGEQLAPVSISISCGVATLIPHPQAQPRDLIALADQELYRAKASGRNRVCVASTSMAALPLPARALAGS